MPFVFPRNSKSSFSIAPAVASGVLLLSSLLLAGCRPTTIPAKAPPLPEGQLPTITVVPGGSQSYWNEARRGAEAAGKKLNAKIVWKVPSGEGDALVKSQRKLMEDAIKVSQGVVAAPVDSTKMMRSFRAVAIAGLPVVAFDRDVYSVQNKLTFVHNDDYQTGVLMAKQVKSNSNGRAELFNGKVGILDPQSGLFNERAGMLDPQGNNNLSATERSEAIQKNLRERLIETVMYSHIDSTNRKTFVGTSILLAPKSEDAKHILKVWAYQVVRPRLVAFGADDELLRLTAKGQISTLITPNYYEMGYQSVKAILDFRKLNYPPREIKIAPRLITRESIKTSTQPKAKPN